MGGLEKVHRYIGNYFVELIKSDNLIYAYCLGMSQKQISLGPDCAYFHMQTLKPRVAKVSTVCVRKTFALAAQHSERKCESSLSSSPNWLVVI